MIDPKAMPFDAKDMIYGGFNVLERITSRSVCIVA
jgi:hypothetical protein